MNKFTAALAVFLLSIQQQISAGIILSCAAKKKDMDAVSTVETKESKQLAKVRRINETVDALTLPKILVLHLRAGTLDYNQYNISMEDAALFRNRVMQRYYEHQEEIDRMAHESDERARHTIHAVPARHLRRDRRRPVRIRRHASIAGQIR